MRRSKTSAMDRLEPPALRAPEEEEESGGEEEGGG
jgi:hypothetical protein